MILTINYDKATKVITLSSNESEVSVEVNTSETIDTASKLNFEVALDLSLYQDLFNDEILEDGDNNE